MKQAAGALQRAACPRRSLHPDTPDARPTGRTGARSPRTSSGPRACHSASADATPTRFGTPVTIVATATASTA
ncbi:hypothetical protein, partial [Burkholderia territorii]|uniref:hypothetical protein n=1 Tax=Burkholderia territorii TaxID=1503055 RepID=UPI001BA5E9B0